MKRVKADNILQAHKGENGDTSGIDIYKKVIGDNIGKIQKKLGLTNPQFFERLYPGENHDDKYKANVISKMKRGELNIEKVITVAIKTNTPIAELFTGIEEKNKDTSPTAYDVCRTFYSILSSGRFNIEGTSKLQKQGKVISFEKEKPELDKHYDFPPCFSPDAPKTFDEYPQPIYIRIMPRYFLKGDMEVIEYMDTKEILQFIQNALELYSCDLPEESKFHYIRSELEKISKKSISGKDFWVAGEYLYPLDFHEPW